VSVKKLLQSIVKLVFSPKENLTSCGWVEKYCSLPAKTSNKSGQFTTKYNPFVREFFNLFDNNRTQSAAICKGTQLGLSLFAALALTKIAVVNQKPAIYYSINKDKVKEFSCQKFRPIIDDCKEAAPIIPKNKDKLTTTNFEFNTTTVALESASALSAFKSASACYVLYDELDSAEEFKGEAPTYKLACDRITSYGIEGKIIYFSSPSDSNSKIFKLFLEGSQEYYNVPCKLCGHLQALTFEQIKFDSSTEEAPLSIDKRAESARYECIACKGLMYERDKMAMLDAGEWIQTNFDCAKDKRSFHISSLYSSDISWAKLVKEWLEAMASNDLEQLRHFRNSRLALPYENITVNNTTKDVDEMIAASPVYNKGQLTFRPKAIFSGGDMQRDSLYYVTYALDDANNRYVLNYANVANTDEFQRAVTEKTYTFDGRDYFNEWAWLDCGYEPEAVFDLHLKSNRFISACRGVKTEAGSPDINNCVVSYKGNDVPRFDLKDSFYKMRLIKTIIQSKNIKLFLPKDTDTEFKRQLVNEKIIIVKKNGKFIEKFKDGSRNHYFDCVKYCEALVDKFINSELF
jgi:phage terminase large subunit GpA-like protein